MEKTKDLTAYNNRFNEDPSTFNDFQAMDYVRELKNQGKNDEAIEVGKTFLQYEELTSFINQYAYALYNKFINIDEEKINERENLFNSIYDEIISLTKQEKFSPLEVTVNRKIKHILAAKEIDYAELSKVLDNLDPMLCNTEPLKGNNGIEFESRRERWFRLKVRSLYETGNYAKCVEVSNIASTQPLKWHNAALNWILYYRANSLVKLERYEEATNEFMAIGKRLPIGNTDEIIYELYLNTGKVKEAYTNLIYRFFRAGYDIENIKLYTQIADMIKTNESQEQLIKIVNSFLHQLLSENGKDAKDYELDESFASKDSSELYDRLYNGLMNRLDAYIDRASGKVTRYFEDRGFGNIADGKEGVFFRQSDYIYDEIVERRDTVEYSVIKAYDVKKKQTTYRAVLLKTLDF